MAILYLSKLRTRYIALKQDILSYICLLCDIIENEGKETCRARGRIKSFRGPRPVFSAGPRALKNVVGCGCVLDALLFM
jgi:hypothetical protein